MYNATVQFYELFMTLKRNCTPVKQSLPPLAGAESCVPAVWQGTREKVGGGGGGGCRLQEPAPPRLVMPFWRFPSLEPLPNLLVPLTLSPHIPALGDSKCRLRANGSQMKVSHGHSPESPGSPPALVERGLMPPNPTLDLSP